MLVAHLRGLLRKSHRYGVQSITSENIILEALSAEILASGIKTDVMADLSLVPAMKHDGVVQIYGKAGPRLRRAGELMLLDIYKVADQVASGLKRETKTELSLFQLYQIAEKSGIFDTLDDHYREENSRPLL